MQEAAYALIPEELRTEAHLRIGRRLAAHIPPEEQEAAIFDVVNQLNRGVTLITSREEREHLAELNLRAGKRAKASTAYTSALTYLVVGATLLPEDSWERRHELTFELELLRAECEFLTGAMVASDERLKGLSSRAANTVERALVACLHIDLYTTVAQSSYAIAVGLDYLRHLGIEWSPHPTDDDVRREYDRIWLQLATRSIEDILELPLMTDPASLATMDVLTKIAPAAFTLMEANFHALAVCWAANLSLERGNSDASCDVYVRLGFIAGDRFGDYKSGSRFGKVGYDLVERWGLKRFQARTYLLFAHFLIPYTRHVKAGRDLLDRGFEVANKIGDLMFVGWYRGLYLIENLLASGDPLSEVQREAERGLAFAQKAQLVHVAYIVQTHLELIRTLRGLTRKFGSFDEEDGDARFARNPNSAFAEWLYCVRKVQAHFHAANTCWPSRQQRGRNGIRRQDTSTRLPIFTFIALCPTPQFATGPTGDHISQRCPLITDNSRTGRSNARRTSKAAPRWSGRRLLASNAATATRCPSMNWPFGPRAAADLCTTRQSPMNVLPRPIGRESSMSWLTSTCGTPAIATCVGALLGRCSSWTRFMRTCGTER